MINLFPDKAESNAAADDLSKKYTTEELDYERYQYEGSKIIRSEV